MISGHIILHRSYAKMIGCNIAAECSEEPENIGTIFEHIGITSALVMTTVAGLMTVELSKAAGHSDEPGVEELITTINGLMTTELSKTAKHGEIRALTTSFAPRRHWHSSGDDVEYKLAIRFGAVAMTSLLASTACVMLSVINYLDLNALDKTEAKKWAKDHNEGIGEVVIFMLESYFFFMLSIVVWCQFAFGDSFARCAAVMAFSCALNVVWRCSQLLAGRPQRCESCGFQKPDPKQKHSTPKHQDAENSSNSPKHCTCPEKALRSTFGVFVAARLFGAKKSEGKTGEMEPLVPKTSRKSIPPPPTPPPRKPSTTQSVRTGFRKMKFCVGVPTLACKLHPPADRNPASSPSELPL